MSDQVHEILIESALVVMSQAADEAASLRAENAALRARMDGLQTLQDFWDQQGEWSERTFGTSAERGPIGSLRHLANEVQEAIADPTDIVEFADCLSLTLDAVRRAGFTLLELLAAAHAKLAVNKLRQWEKPTTDEAVSHVRLISDAASAEAGR